MQTSRKLGLTAALAMAFVALFGVGNALASNLTASAYPVSVNASQPGGSKLYFSGGAVATGCSGIQMSGTLSAAASSLATIPNGGNCTYFGESKIAYNGCQVTFNFGSDAGHFGRYDGTMDIGPANCGPIQLTKGNAMCEISLPAQSGLYVSFENAGSGVTANLNATGVKYTLNGACGSKSGSNGTLMGSFNLVGLGEAIQVEEDPHAPLFEAESYPSSVSGSSVGQHTFVNQGWMTNRCKGVSLAGTVSSASGSVTASPGFEGCEVLGIPATLSTNGCTYEFHLGSKLAAGRYSGTADIDCPPGKAIESSMSPQMCTWKIPAQSGLSGVEFINNSSSGHQLEVKFALTGMQWSIIANWIFCPISEDKSFSNGKQTGTVMVAGGEGNGIRVGG